LYPKYELLDQLILAFLGVCLVGGAVTVIALVFR
jgi:hypothetical protein